jgi:hypothetical protein
MPKDPIKESRKENVRERSFGEAPPVIQIQGGEMHTFGHKTRSAIWPMATDPTSPKTGYPEGHMNKKAGVVPK